MFFALHVLNSLVPESLDSNTLPQRQTRESGERERKREGERDGERERFAGQAAFGWSGASLHCPIQKLGPGRVREGSTTQESGAFCPCEREGGGDRDRQLISEGCEGRSPRFFCNYLTVTKRKTRNSDTNGAS